MLADKELGQLIISDVLIVENILGDLVRKIKIFDERKSYREVGLAIATVLYDMLETVDQKIYDRYPELKTVREYYHHAQTNESMGPDIA